MTTIAWGQHISNTQKLGEPVPAGQYPAICEEALFTSSSKGDPQWKMRWRLIGGPHNNRTILDNQTLATGTDEKAPIRRGFFFQAMEQLGMPSEFFIQANPPGELVAQRLQGINALLDLTINDRNFNNVQRYTLTGGAQPMEQQAQPQGFNPAAQQMPQAQPGGFQPPQPQGFDQQMPQPQVQPQPQGYQPAAAQPYPQQMPQAQPQPGQGYVDPSQQQMQPQGGFQQAQPQVQAQGQPMAPMQAGMPMAPQGGYVPEQAGQVQPQPQVGPDGQPLAQNGQQGPQVNFTPQPRPPF